MKKSRIALATLTAAVIASSTGGLVACSKDDPEGPGGVYTIELDANNGEFSDGAIVKVTTVGGKLTELPAAPDIPPQKDYTFVGWSLTAGGSIIDIDQTFSSDDVLYAIWAPPENPDPKPDPTVGVFTVSFDAGAGTLDTETLKTAGGKLSSLPTPTPPAGMKFEGWYTEPNGAGRWVTKSYTFNGPTVVYAYYVSATGPVEERVTVTLDLGDGSLAEGQATLSVIKGGTVVLPTAVTPPFGYEFDGWYTQKTSGTKLTGTETYNADTTIYAIYKPREIPADVKNYVEINGLKQELEYTADDNETDTLVGEYKLQYVGLDKGVTVKFFIDGVELDESVDNKTIWIESGSHGVENIASRGNGVVTAAEGKFSFYLKYYTDGGATRNGGYTLYVDGPDTTGGGGGGGNEDPVTDTEFYVIGSFNGWKVGADCKLEKSASQSADGKDQYCGTIVLEPGDELKVVNADKTTYYSSWELWNSGVDWPYAEIMEKGTPESQHTDKYGNLRILSPGVYEIYFKVNPDNTKDTAIYVGLAAEAPPASYAIGAGTAVDLDDNTADKDENETARYEYITSAKVTLSADDEITFRLNGKALSGVQMSPSSHGVMKSGNKFIVLQSGDFDIRLRYYDDNHVWVAEISDGKTETITPNSHYVVGDSIGWTPLEAYELKASNSYTVQLPLRKGDRFKVAGTDTDSELEWNDYTLVNDPAVVSGANTEGSELTALYSGTYTIVFDPVKGEITVSIVGGIPAPTYEAVVDGTGYAMADSLPAQLPEGSKQDIERSVTLTGLTAGQAVSIYVSDDQTELGNVAGVGIGSFAGDKLSFTVAHDGDYKVYLKHYSDNATYWEVWVEEIGSTIKADLYYVVFSADDWELDAANALTLVDCDDTDVDKQFHGVISLSKGDVIKIRKGTSYGSEGWFGGFEDGIATSIGAKDNSGNFVVAATDTANYDIYFKLYKSSTGRQPSVWIAKASQTPPVIEEVKVKIGDAAASEIDENPEYTGTGKQYYVVSADFTSGQDLSFTYNGAAVSFFVDPDETCVGVTKTEATTGTANTSVKMTATGKYDIYLTHNADKTWTLYTSQSAVTGVTCTVTLDPNGGTLKGGSTATTGANGKFAELPEAPDAPDPALNFGGWFTAREGGTKINTNTVFTEATATIYAHWDSEPLTDCIIVGGRETALTKNNQASADYTYEYFLRGATYTQNTDISIRIAGTDVTLFWLRDESSGIVGESGNKAYVTVEPGTYDIYVRLYKNGDGKINVAVFKHVGSHTVTFDVNGGDALDPSAASATTEPTFGKLSSLPTPTKADSAFAGWYTAREGGEKVTLSKQYTTDTTLYAHWGETVPAPQGVTMNSSDAYLVGTVADSNINWTDTGYKAITTTTNFYDNDVPQIKVVGVYLNAGDTVKIKQGSHWYGTLASECDTVPDEHKPDYSTLAKHPADSDNIIVQQTGYYSFYVNVTTTAADSDGSCPIYIAFSETDPYDTYSLALSGATVSIRVNASQISGFTLKGAHVWKEGGAETDWTTVSGTNIDDDNNTITGADSVPTDDLYLIFRSSDRQTVNIHVGKVVDGGIYTITLTDMTESGNYKCDAIEKDEPDLSRAVLNSYNVPATVEAENCVLDNWVIAGGSTDKAVSNASASGGKYLWALTGTVDSNNYLTFTVDVNKHGGGGM